jgi:hypothetical protein
MTPGSEETEPSVGVECVRVRPLGERGLWDISWRVRNLGTEPILLREAWLPHGRFRAPRVSYEPPRTIEAGEDVELSFGVAVDEPPGVEVENAFVILNVGWRGDPWRIFARIRVVVGPGGTPNPLTETYSQQRISGIG